MTATLGSRIAARRAELKITQRELARRIDCTTTALCKIEKGHTKNPSARVILGLSKHLKMSAQTLLGGRRA